MSVLTQSELLSQAVRPTSQCLACGSAHQMLEVFDLGEPYLSNFVLPSETKSCRKFPLKVVFCQECKLAQLSHHAPADWSFRHYWYRSGITQSMKKQLAEIVSKASEFVGLDDRDAVCDIGANDGTMLRMYPQAVRRVGFEPALNLTELGREGGNEILRTYFTRDGFAEKTFKIVTAIAMFYDLADPLSFLQDVEHVMTDDGVFILQMNYAPLMIKNLAFDNIGHEHLAYYSLGSLVPLLNRAALHPCKVEFNDTNGGSIRLYVTKKRTCTPEEYQEVGKALDEEYFSHFDTPRTWLDFAERISVTKETVRNTLFQAQAQGRRIWACGASTRGSTLVQYFGLDHTLIEGFSERDERKYGRLTTGSWIPIFPEQEARLKADVMIVLPWHFKTELVAREREFLVQGGQLLFPFPEPVLVTQNGDKAL